MNKNELANKLAEVTGLTKKDSLAAVKAYETIVKEAVNAGEKVGLVGFGVFQPAERSARTSRNPKTGEPVAVEAKTVPKFKPSNQWKEEMLGK